MFIIDNYKLFIVFLNIHLQKTYLFYVHNFLFVYWEFYLKKRKPVFSICNLLICIFVSHEIHFPTKIFAFFIFCF